MDEQSVEWLSYRGIKCYTPQENNDTITFEFKKLSDYDLPTTHSVSVKIAQDALEGVECIFNHAKLEVILIKTKRYVSIS